MQELVDHLYIREQAFHACVHVLTNTSSWANAGGMFIKLSQEKLEKWEGVRFEGLQGINAKRALLLVTVMGAHALGEGSGVGVSFCGDRGWAQVPATHSTFLDHLFCRQNEDCTDVKSH